MDLTRIPVRDIGRQIAAYLGTHQVYVGMAVLVSALSIFALSPGFAHSTSNSDDNQAGDSPEQTGTDPAKDTSTDNSKDANVDTAKDVSSDTPKDVDAEVPKDTSSESSSGTSSSRPNMLKGKAEVITTRDSNLRAWQSSQLYKQGVAYLNVRNYRLAADCFKRATPGFDQDGFEKFQAEAEFAEAQSRRFLGQAQEASRLYQAAIDLFNQYDPLSPYLKAALDNLERISPNLKGLVERDKARLQLLKTSKGIMTVDRNIVLKGGLTNYSGKFLADKETADFPLDYVHDVIHKAFVRMTCLETAQLGSNYLKAETSWYTLLTNGHTVALSASSDFITPTIKVKINERFYNIDVQLPDLAANKRTVFLLTDGTHIIAIDPITEDMWNLKAEFDQEPPKFTWIKLSHIKNKKRII